MKKLLNLEKRVSEELRQPQEMAVNLRAYREGRTAYSPDNPVLNSLLKI